MRTPIINCELRLEDGQKWQGGKKSEGGLMSEDGLKSEGGLRQAADWAASDCRRRAKNYMGDTKVPRPAASQQLQTKDFVNPGKTDSPVVLPRRKKSPVEIPLGEEAPPEAEQQQQ